MLEESLASNTYHELWIQYANNHECSGTGNKGNQADSITANACIEPISVETKLTKGMRLKAGIPWERREQGPRYPNTAKTQCHKIKYDNTSDLLKTRTSSSKRLRGNDVQA